MNSDTSVIVKPTMPMRDLCARTGATPRMIRHYEKVGILAPVRESNGYRRFTDDDVRTVVDARCLIDAGLTATEAAELVTVVCGEGDVALEQLGTALARIAERRVAMEERIRNLLDARAKLDELRDYVQDLLEVRR